MNNNEIFTEEERELQNKWVEYNNYLKEQGMRKVSFNDFKQWYINNETLKKYNQPVLTFPQWYHTIKEKEYNDQLKREEYKANKQLIDNLENEKTEFEQLQSDYLGKFHFHFYNETLTLNIAPQYLVRFAYLCCYLDYNDNKIYFGKSNNRLAIGKDLKEIWNISERETRNTKNALIDKGLIKINEDKTISVNRKYALKGNVNNDNKLRGGVKMFEYGIKELYENSKPTEHKQLGILIKLLPCVNYDWNVLCVNPTETDEDKVIPLTLKDICRVVGYDESNSNRLKKELLKIKVNDKYAICIHTMGDKNAVSINPMIYYKGKRYEAMEHLIALFKMKPNK